MKKYLKLILLFCLLNILSSSSTAFEKAFYVLRYSSPDRMTSPENIFTSLKENYKKIDILIPQAYVINATGEIEKEIEPEILNFALNHSMKIMPLVTNKKFDSNLAHQFLTDTSAQNKAIDRLISLCVKYKFYGLQLDFEMIHISDKDNLTHFYELFAKKMHQQGLHISFAVAPVVTDNPTSLFLEKIYNNWEGAYDLAAIGKVADFISIMAYNQHGGGLTTPGPTAGFPWVNQAIKYALQYVPASKISIGIADYTTHWYTGSVEIDKVEKISVKMRALSHEDALMIMQSNKLHSIWDKQEKIPYVIFPKNWLNEYLFIEDKKSFSEKLKLVKKYHLRGISVFDLGTEDKKIWENL